MSDMEYSDNEPILDNLTLYTWTAGSDDRNQYEIFLVYAITGECELQGYSFDISRSIKEAVPQITDSLRQAEAGFRVEDTVTHSRRLHGEAARRW